MREGASGCPQRRSDSWTRSVQSLTLKRVSLHLPKGVYQCKHKRVSLRDPSILPDGEDSPRGRSGARFRGLARNAWRLSMPGITKTSSTSLVTPPALPLRLRRAPPAQAITLTALGSYR
jgi:hypothetical protein